MDRTTGATNRDVAQPADGDLARQHQRADQARAWRDRLRMARRLRHPGAVRDLRRPLGRPFFRGGNRAIALAASECTSALKTLIKYHRYPNETPHYILVMHAIELALKAFLMKNAVDEKKLKSYGHDLNRLYKIAVKLGLSLDEPNAFDLIACINEWHQTVKMFTIERELPACS